MIYIDPPYNTGKDFVYCDNFRDNIKNYLEITGQVDNEGDVVECKTLFEFTKQKNLIKLKTQDQTRYMGR